MLNKFQHFIIKYQFNILIKYIFNKKYQLIPEKYIKLYIERNNVKLNE